MQDTVHTTSHFAGGIIWRLGDEEEEFLVIEYESGAGKQIKFPGGTNNDRLGEEMVATLRREVEEETQLRVTMFKPIFQSEGPGHTKRFFLIPFELCHGNMRTLPMRDNDGDKLSPPFWHTAKELLRDPKKGGLFYTHRSALEAAVLELESNRV